MDGGNTVPTITRAEHIGPLATGDNIEAKRVAGYQWDPGTGEWTRDKGQIDYARKITVVGDDTYIAKAAVGSAHASAVWQAQKIDVDGSATWADGNSNFDNVATSLPSLTYS